ncbi:MAG: hypothetical protein FVQ83_13620 [Chloroflexi bacterium]|nr:hypothetical protein [Chloroflexota bacterium]
MRGHLCNLSFTAFTAFVTVLAACSTGPQQSTIPWQLPDGFPTAVYPPPLPALAEGGAILAGCPNPAGLEELERVSSSTAIMLLEGLWSDDEELTQRAADPALWPNLADISPREVRPQLSWLDGPVVPASESPFASSLMHQCGETLVKASWTFTVCPSECMDNSSASLKEDYFLISRAGRLLIWAVWP